MKKLNRKITDKVEQKLIDGECKFCKEKDYCILSVHRIIPGEEGGEYTLLNCVTLCENCHRKVHAEVIKIDRWYESSMGRLLHYFDEYGEEHYIP